MEAAFLKMLLKGVDIFKGIKKETDYSQIEDSCMDYLANEYLQSQDSLARIFNEIKEEIKN